jgi:hypothetical protein
MRSRDVTVRESRVRHVKLLIFAWAMALASLPAPGEDTPVILFLFRVPVCWMASSAFIAPFYPGFRFMGAVAIGIVLFLLSPVTYVGRMTRRRNLWQRVISLGLLGPWMFPIVLEFFTTPQERHQWGFEHLAWGWYLFATAHTIAFIAIQIGPRPASKADRRRGFPVVPLSNGGSPGSTT